MPWTGSSFAKHNHGLTGPESSHAARIANAVLRRSHDDGLALAVANKYFQRHDGGGQVDDGPPDMSARYNTPLSATDESKYQAWATAQGRANDTYDYDLRGAYRSGAAASANGHLPDTYKKPNHPTFSDQSQYHGVDGHQGGSWSPLKSGSWQFAPSPTNLQMHGAPGLQQYFREREPGSQLVLPQRATGGIMRYDGGGQVDPTSPGIGGLAPSTEAANPLYRGMVQRYASLPVEKLQELAVTMGGSPQGHIIRSVLDQKRMLPNAGTAPVETANTGYRRGGKVKKRANGGLMPLGVADPVWSRAQSRAEVGGAGATGYLHGPTPGRADAILTTAPAGSYVIPADVVSGLGEGNGLAGANVMDRIIRTGPNGIKAMPSARVSHGPPRAPAVYHQAKGGSMGTPYARQEPVALSHGEYVVQPDFVAQWGRGDHGAGVQAFDRWVVKKRRQIIAEMKKLPGPVGAKKQ